MQSHNPRKLQKEQDILDDAFRAQVIREMTKDQEIIQRKASMLRRYEVYRDNTIKWVLHALNAEGYREETLAQMRNRASNVSIARKVVNKLAQTYIGGVDRRCDDSRGQEAVDLLSDELDFDSAMKKADRYRQLFRNTTVGTMPILDTASSMEVEKYRLKTMVFAPWEYDVIEDPNDPEKALVYIFTDFLERRNYDSPDPHYAEAAKGYRTSGLGTRSGDGKDQAVADSAEDAGTNDRRFIWWSPSFHFTTDKTGKIVQDVSPNDLSNPIKMLPLVDLNEEQDGNYWSQGGQDVVEQSIQINKKLTDVSYIQFVQGWGQAVLTGKDLDKAIELGPDNLLKLEHDGTVEPKFTFASSNPDIQSWLDSIRVDLALLLSTNNLSPRTISAKLDTQNLASGISMLIENAEVLSDQKDTQKKFQDKEPVMWEIIRRWHELYKDSNSLIEAFDRIETFQDSNVSLIFHESRAPITTKEKLEELKLKKSLGLISHMGMLKEMYPDMSESQIEQMMDDIKKEKQENAANFGLPVVTKEGQDDEEDEGEEQPPEGEDQDDEVED